MAQFEVFALHLYSPSSLIRFFIWTIVFPVVQGTSIVISHSLGSGSGTGM